MTSSLRHALISIAIVVLAVIAHGRLLQAGWLGGDLLVASALEVDGPAAPARAWILDGGVRPVPTLALRALGAAQSSAPREDLLEPWSVRVVAFVVVLLGALVAGFALRRALSPWVGGDTARAAAFACALFVAVHPLAGAAIARPRALGDICVWFLGALCAFLFLRGRQMREKGWIVGAGVAAILAGFSSSSAWLVPCVLAALELGSAQRPRPLSDRLRTAFTTLLLFTACVFIESVAAVAVRARPTFASGFPDFSAWASPGHSLQASVEKLGLLFFPITGGSPFESWPSYLVCVAIVLIALWPVLRSARVAPRLWGSLAVAWIVLMLLALVAEAGVSVTPRDGSRADVLFLAAALAASGLAVATTSLLGTRRIVLPALIAIGLSWLSWRAANQYVSATDVVSRLRANVASAARDFSPEGRVLVVDPPHDVLGFDLEWDRVWSSSPGRSSAERSPRPTTIEIPAVSIPFLTRTQMFVEWRAHKVAFLEHGQPQRGPLDVPDRVRVVSPTVGTKQPPWRGESRSPLFDLDPATVRFARVLALPGTSSAEAPRMAWRASEPAGEWVVATGVWIEDQRGLSALFDPWRHESWWTASTVRRVRGEDPLVNVASFELLEDLPLTIDGAAPRADRSDWTFRVRRDDLVRPVRGSAEFVLEVLVLEAESRLSHARFDCEESAAEDGLVLRARGAEGYLQSARARGARAVEWSLERRVGEVALARASGNLPR